MIMVHGDDKGLVLPPRVAPIQVVVVPIPFKNQDEVEEIFAKADEIVAKLTDAGVRIEADKRRVYTPGWKYNHWELKGVPLRFEVGPKDIAKKQVRVVRRDNGAKEDIPEAELATRIPALLEQIQQDMLERATAERDSHIREVTEWKDFVPALQEGCMVLTLFCNEIEGGGREDQKSRGVAGPHGSGGRGRERGYERCRQDAVHPVQEERRDPGGRRRQVLHQWQAGQVLGALGPQLLDRRCVSNKWRRQLVQSGAMLRCSGTSAPGRSRDEWMS